MQKHKMPNFLLSIALALLIVSGCECLAGDYEVARVTDGDTVVVIKGNVKLTIRLVGIDAPEISHKKYDPSQPFGRQSTKYLGSLVLNKPVSIKSFGNDRYGRILGVVYAEGKNINLEMVRAGLAEVYRGSPAHGQVLGPYWEAEREAKHSRRGMWVQGDKYVSPREWRKSQK